MLKIKDNVDLKVLEKYGFIKVKKGMSDFVPEVKYWCTFNDSEYDCITIFKDRHIYLGLDMTNTYKLYDVLYDLIKDGLVEKVD